MSRVRILSYAATALTAALAFSAVASAQSINFESYNASAAGTPVTGQDGWAIPAAGGTDGLVFTYTGNRFGIVQNPAGGTKFLASRRVGNPPNFARAERSGLWGDGLTGCRRMCFDINGLFVVDSDSDPAGPGQNNLGSISIQPYPANGAILLAFWGDPNDPNFAGSDTWNLGGTGNYDVNGNAQPAGQVTYFPNSQFINIPQNQWMHVCANVDLDLNAITRLEISQVNSSNVDVFEPDLTVDYFYMAGGSTQLGPISGLRLFGGGGGGTDITGAGNTLAMDNLNIAGTCATNNCTCPGDFNGDHAVGLSDLTLFLASFGGAPSNPCMDVNSDGVIGLSDLTAFLSHFGSTCQ